MSEPDVTVVIPTRNNADGLSCLLPELRRQEGLGDVDILVMDNASRDETAAVARRYGARVIAVPEGEFNHGLTRDRAVSEAKHDCVVLTVSDAVPITRTWARDLVSHLDADRVAGAYGIQVPWPAAPAIAWQAYYSRFNDASAASGAIVQRLPPGIRFDDLSPDGRCALTSFDDVTSAIRRDVWRETPFGRTNYAEDVRWARAVLERGYAVVFEPRAAVLHSHDARPLRYEFGRSVVDSQARYEVNGLRRWWRHIPSMIRLRGHVRRVERGEIPLPPGISPPRVGAGQLARGYLLHGVRAAGNIAFLAYARGWGGNGAYGRWVRGILDEFS